tara:strand:- start:409 stop:747 length:339 start_codon:yes stop_codon:yes gene_type:complete
MKSKNNFREDNRRLWESYVNREAEDSGADHHNQYMMDQDLLQPLHAAAIKTGAKDINDWMIRQIKEQGQNWIDWFIETVIGDVEEYSDWNAKNDPDQIGRIPPGSPGDQYNQ